MSERTAVIIGASAGLGRSLTERLAADGWDLVITSRSATDLEQLADDIRQRHGVQVTPLAVDLTDDDSAISSYVTAVDAVTRPDAVLITAGSIASVDDGVGDWATTSELVAGNMTGVMKVAGHFMAGFEERNRGTLVLFSSIAAGAPRSKNVAYAAAKAGLESFAGSMQHRVGRSKVAVQLYRLGYVDTRLAQGQDLKLKPADPDQVARRVVEHLDGSSRTVFEPRYWSLIVRGLQILPAPIYNRIDF